MARGARGHAAARGGVVAERADRGPERSGIGGWHDEPDLAVRDDLRQPPDARRDDRKARGHRLEGHGRGALAPPVGQDA